MKIGIMAAAPAEICRAFIEQYGEALVENGVEISVVVIDENRSKSESPLSHALKVAQRQSKHAGCSTAMGVLKILFYKALTKFAGGGGDAEPTAIPASIKQVVVSTLNALEAVAAIRDNGCELVCLMGTRILTEKTLRALSVPLINVHSSDPSFMRGAPAVVWEILAGRDVITLTIHEVVAKLDAGRILAQKPCPIVFASGLAPTTLKTMVRAQPMVTSLFYEVILGLKNGTIKPQEFVLGPLKVTPSLKETLHADLICRRKSPCS